MKLTFLTCFGVNPVCFANIAFSDSFGYLMKHQKTYKRISRVSSMISTSWREEKKKKSKRVRKNVRMKEMLKEPRTKDGDRAFWETPLRPPSMSHCGKLIDSPLLSQLHVHIAQTRNC